MKRDYEEPILTVIVLSDKDVLVSSSVGGGGVTLPKDEFE